MDRIIKLLDTQGPSTGKELRDQSKTDELSLWRICNKSDKIITKIVGKRFLRLDKRVEGYARLSPSIMREFLTYTVIGLEKNAREINLKAKSLHENIRDISKKKFELAQKIIVKIVESQDKSETIKTRACFIISGDIVYKMAHAEPRPEISTGKLVNGSDLDIIVVTENLSKKIIRDLDTAIYREKYYLIKHPGYKEEIDYIIKDTATVEEQLQFDNFKLMVASKILYESKFMYGEQKIFKKIKEMLFAKEIPEKLQTIEKKAAANREAAESYLLNGTGTLSEQESLKLFYTKEEKEEIF